jgi:predicted Zn-ribbon and HTH transcriptional regulator
MWKKFGFGKREPAASPPSADDQAGALDAALAALDQGEQERELPTLVCRQCGLQYANTGTYLQGARCPECHPGG